MSQFDDSSSTRSGKKISAESFVATLAVNVDNGSLSAEAFRQMVRNTLPIVAGANYSVGQSQSRGTSSQFDDRGGSQFGDH